MGIAKVGPSIERPPFLLGDGGRWSKMIHSQLYQSNVHRLDLFHNRCLQDYHDQYVGPVTQPMKAHTCIRTLTSRIAGSNISIPPRARVLTVQTPSKQTLFTHVMSPKNQSTPAEPSRLFDIAVTATADEFRGVYRGKQYHSPDFDAVLDRASIAGVEKILLTGMSPSDIKTNCDIAMSRPGQCRVTAGVHPYFAAEPESSEEGQDTYWITFIDTVERLMTERPRLISAYGELGLDYDHIEKASKERQICTFKKQLDLFVDRKIDLPLFLHCRSAFEDFVDILTPYLNCLPRGGVVHSFVGTPSQMHTLVTMNLDISVNGFSFRSEESIQMVKEIPLGKLQIETDAPWGEIGTGSEVAKKYLGHARELPGAVKKRNKFEAGSRVKERNESCSLERVAMVVAGVKGLEVGVIVETTWENSWRMFGFE